MARRSRLGSLALFLSAVACAPVVAVKTAPGSTAATRWYLVGALAFEAPAALRARAFHDGLVLSACTRERDPAACGSLGVWLRELAPEHCRDREYVRDWLRRPFPADQPRSAVRLGDRTGWMFDAGVPNAHRILVLCDAAGTWVVSERALGDAGDAPAREAFDLFVRTARFEPAPAAPAGR